MKPFSAALLPVSRIAELRAFALAAQFLSTIGVSQTVITNCIAQGVPADGSYEQLNAQISVLTSGNENLTPEKVDEILDALP